MYDENIVQNTQERRILRFSIADCDGFWMQGLLRTILLELFYWTLVDVKQKYSYERCPALKKAFTVSTVF